MRRNGMRCEVAKCEETKKEAANGADCVASDLWQNSRWKEWKKRRAAPFKSDPKFSNLFSSFLCLRQAHSRKEEMV